MLKMSERSHSNSGRAVGGQIPQNDAFFSLMDYQKERLNEEMYRFKQNSASWLTTFAALSGGFTSAVDDMFDASVTGCDFYKPLDGVKLSTNSRVLSRYTSAFYFLGVFGATEWVGRMLGWVLLSWWINRAGSFMTLFVIIPSVYIWAKSRAGCTANTRKLLRPYDLLLAAIFGLLHGFNLRSHLNITVIPLCLIPILQATTIRFVVPWTVGDDRLAIIGVVAMTWLIPVFAVGIVFEGLTIASVTFWLAAAVLSAVVFQFVLIRSLDSRCRYLDDYGQLVLLEIIVILKTLVTSLFVQTLAEYYRQQQQLLHDQQPLHNSPPTPKEVVH